MRVEKDNIIVVRSPVTDLKAIKNEVEVEGMSLVRGGHESRVEFAGNRVQAIAH